MLTGNALRQVQADPAVRQVLDGADIYVIGKGRADAAAAGRTVPTVSFASYQAMRSALTRDELPAGTQAVLLDLEAWPLTPRDEQQQAAAVYAQAAALARTHGLRFVATPGMDLVRALDAGGRGPFPARFLASGLLRSIAAHADVIDVQAQSLERQPAAYAAFVRQAAAQIRAANPRVTVLAGLSANPAGAPVTAGQLAAAIGAVRGVVCGFWMNIPGRGPQCPACNPPAPHVAIAAMGAAR
jgi:hypothetical protein